MADDVEVMSGEDTEDVDVCVVVSESKISTTDTVIDVVSTGELSAEPHCDNGAVVIDDDDHQCSVSNSCQNPDSQPCDADSSFSIQDKPENLVIDKTTTPQCESSHVTNAQPIQVSNGSENEIKCGCHSDNESEIIVDDSPSPAVENNDKKDGSNRESLQDTDNLRSSNGDNGLRIIIRSRSVTPSPSIVRLSTPNTPSTPRVRSGSVSGTTYAPLSPKPSPSARATPGERQRAGSMGEIEMRDKILGREYRQGVRIIDNLDVLQLPRPRNPGGILPLNGHNPFNDSNEALNLSLDDRQQTKPIAGSIKSILDSFSPIFPSTSTASKSGAGEKRPNTSYLISNIIRTTPNKQKASSNVTASMSGSLVGRTRGCAINESVERPLPSSIVDSEGVAKKIARLDSDGFMCSSTADLWNNSGLVASSDELLSRVRVISDKTPPERPKPPRRALASPADTDRTFVSSSVRRRLSPAHINPTLLRNGASNNGYGSGSTCVYPTSPDADICQLSHHYNCRICNYSTSSYNQLQLHSSKHGGNGKMFRCSMCDYSTFDKAHFRRHRRMHHKTSPGTVFKCVKCAYVTSLSRKLREHYQQAHPDAPDPEHVTGLASVSQVSPQRFVGSHGYPVESSRHYAGHLYDSPLIAERGNRLGFPFSVTGRQTQMNLPLDQFDVPYSSYQERNNDNIPSSYIQPYLSSVMNSESRQAPTSTVTSSDYYMPVENVHPIQDIHTCNRHATCNGVHTEVKIKIEADTETGCDISSTGNHAANLSMPDITKNLTDAQGYPGSDSDHSGLNVASSLHLTIAPRHGRGERDMFSNRNSNIPTDLTRTRKRGPSLDMVSTSEVAHVRDDHHENGSNITHNVNIQSPPPSNTIVKSDRTTRGIQCVLPVIKTEIDLDGDYFDFVGRPRFRGTDRAVQCNFSNSNSTPSTRSQCHTARTGNRSQSVSESDGSEHQSSTCGESRCDFCGISFDDEVLFSIHIGCHSHTDAFKCNVCGKQCSNKYGFYSHIMRGHQM